ncbi:MAG: hypothetical protein M1831_000546 [Alyxoria varia]|nr:MAG: hypothetical protein M1831_000546 [Alyxoria varia]
MGTPTLMSLPREVRDQIWEEYIDMANPTAADPIKPQNPTVWLFTSGDEWIAKPQKKLLPLLNVIAHTAALQQSNKILRQEVQTCVAEKYTIEMPGAATILREHGTKILDYNTRLLSQIRHILIPSVTYDRPGMSAYFRFVRMPCRSLRTLRMLYDQRWHVFPRTSGRYAKTGWRESEWMRNQLRQLCRLFAEIGFRDARLWAPFSKSMHWRIRLICSHYSALRVVYMGELENDSHLGHYFGVGRMSPESWYEYDEQCMQYK